MKHALTGLLFIVFGTFFNYYAQDYVLGNSSNMGPGFYPYYLSVGLITAGLIIVVKSVLWKS